MSNRVQLAIISPIVFRASMVNCIPTKAWSTVSSWPRSVSGVMWPYPNDKRKHYHAKGRKHAVYKQRCLSIPGKHSKTSNRITRTNKIFPVGIGVTRELSVGLFTFKDEVNLQKRSFNFQYTHHTVQLYQWCHTLWSKLLSRWLFRFWIILFVMVNKNFPLGKSLFLVGTSRFDSTYLLLLKW